MVGGVGGIFGVCRVGGHGSGVVVGVEVALLVTEGVGHGSGEAIGIEVALLVTK